MRDRWRCVTREKVGEEECRNSISGREVELWLLGGYPGNEVGMLGFWRNWHMMA